MEILTILNPGSIDLEPTSRRTDHGGLTAALVSAAMAGANPIGLTLIKRRVTDATDSDTGILKLRSIVKDEAKRRKWKYEHEKRLNLLSDLCVWEYTHRPVCRMCHGSTYIYHVDLITRETCPKCEGTGNGENAVVSRAYYLGVSRNTYYKTWERRRECISKLFEEILPDYEFYAGRHIRKYLRRTVESDS
jgi:hypothetical protein